MKLFVSFLMVVLFAGSALAADDKAAAKVVKPDLAKGEASFSAVCAACHAADGNSMIPANPKLAQQHPEYTASSCRSSSRANAPMRS
jgi:cytochrome c553